MSLDTLTQSSAVPTITTPRRRSLAWLLPTGLLLGFVGIIILLFGQRLLPATEVKTTQVITMRLSSDDTTNEAENTPVAETHQNPSLKNTAESTKGSMLFQASGWIEPDPYTTYVPALINGVIDKVYVLEGQTVKQGDLLASLVDDDAQLKLREANQKLESLEAKIEAHCMGAEIAQAEINAANKKVEASIALLDDAEDHFKRLEKLPLSAIPEQQVVQARLATIRHEALVAEAEASIPQLKARIKQINLERVAMGSNLDELKIQRDQAKLELDRTRIASPMDGVILKLHAAPGKKRMLNMDDPDSAVIVALYNPKKLQARIDVPLTEAAGLQLGQIVDLTSDILPDTIFQGKVTRIRGEADIQRNTLQVKVEILNPDPRLRPEMLVRGKFFTTTSSQASSSRVTSPDQPQRLALFVAEQAIVDNNSVWVVSTKNTAELRTITLGSETRDGYRRVLEGVKSGELTIMPPHTSLEPGSRVRVSNHH